jgi:uncharacterized 2Fe-2S/4Fe-4S cluster protein (DUF4445 family)
LAEGAPLMGAPSCHIGVRREGEPDNAVRQVAFVPGITLRDILNSGYVRARSACAGIGGCGLCKVRIDAGCAGPPTPAETLHLGEEAIAAGVRLACQIVPQSSLDVTVLLQARPSSWRAPILAPYRAHYPISVSPDESDTRLGVAVDLGTTSISVAICDLGSGRRIAVRTGPNPQADLCSDVIGRLQIAAESNETQRQMQILAEQAILDGLFDLLRGEGLRTGSIRRLRVVGNTAMLALLSGADPRPLMEPKNWRDLLDSDAFVHPGLTSVLHMNLDTDVALVPALGGFVGSDLILGVVHTQMIDRPAPSALIDFGTNSEIGLWDGRQLWVTAAAGGPAFEGVGIGCGMAAEQGAIHRLFHSSDGAWGYESIGGGPASGICGSGLIDLMAHLTTGGKIDERGRPQTNPIDLDVAEHRFTVSKADIDSLQQAKAAIAAGLETLSRLADVPLGDLLEIHVAGAFGDHLDLANAVAIGLLPNIPIDRFRLAGNTALSGALDIMLSPMAENRMRTARDKARLINLSMQDYFTDLFVDHLFLRPFKGGRKV